MKNKNTMIFLQKKKQTNALFDCFQFRIQFLFLRHAGFNCFVKYFEISNRSAADWIFRFLQGVMMSQAHHCRH